MSAALFPDSVLLAVVDVVMGWMLALVNCHPGVGICPSILSLDVAGCAPSSMEVAPVLACLAPSPGASQLGSFCLGRVGVAVLVVVFVTPYCVAFLLLILLALLPFLLPAHLVGGVPPSLAAMLVVVTIVLSV